MSVISVLILVVFVASALLLTLIVLIQDDQGGGIGGMFGGGEGGTPFGARTGNVLTRGTAILAAVFLLSAFALAWFNRTPDSSNVIGRARAQRAQSLSDTNWWVESSQTSTSDTASGQAPDAPATSEATLSESASEAEPSSADEPEAAATSE